MATSFIRANVPGVSEAFLESIRAAFPPLVPEPNKHTIEQIMYNAGQQAMLEWIANRVKDSTTHGFDNRSVT